MATLRIQNKLFLNIYLILFYAFLVIFGCEKKKQRKVTAGQNAKTQFETISTDSSTIDLKKNKLESIPQILIDKIAKQYPMCSLPTTDMFIKGWQEFTSETNPFYCSSDFTGNQVSDYAVLLVTEEKDVVLYGFINVDGELHGHQIEKVAKYKEEIPVLIHLCPKGEWESTDESKTIENDGISLELVEESKTWSYFWENGQFVKFLYD